MLEGAMLAVGRDVVLSPDRFAGDFVTLEPVSLLGLDDFHEYSVRAALYEHLEFPPFRTIDESRAYLEKLMHRSSGPDAQYWYIRLAATGKVVGSIGLHSLDCRRASVEVGYGVSPDYWGRGIFAAACATLIDYVFHKLELHRIVARTSSGNIASIKGLEKLRFQREGVMRDYYRSFDGRWFDSVLMARLRTD